MNQFINESIQKWINQKHWDNQSTNLINQSDLISYSIPGDGKGLRFIFLNKMFHLILVEKWGNYKTANKC